MPRETSAERMARIEMMNRLIEENRTRRQVLTTRRYADCALCSQEMRPGVSCTYQLLEVNDVRVHRIPYGQEERFIESLGGDGPCHDCNAPLGGFHHLNCDWEECPFCGGQLLICGCAVSFVHKV